MSLPDFSFDGIGFDVTRTTENPSMPNQVPSMSHWQCVFSKDGATAEVVVSLSDEDYQGLPPDINEALSFIQADIASVAEFPAVEDWVAYAQGEYDEDSYEAYADSHASILRMEQEFAASFGQEWVDGLIGRLSSATPAPGYI